MKLLETEYGGSYFMTKDLCDCTATVNPRIEVRTVQPQISALPDDHLRCTEGNLDPGAHLVQSRDTDREPASEACHHILQRRHDASAGHTQGEADPPRTVFKEHNEEEKADAVSEENHEFPDAISRICLAEVARECCFQDAKRRVDDKNA